MDGVTVGESASEIKVEKGERLDYIDALRGLAVLAVVSLHCGLSTPFLEGRFLQLVVQGQNGVPLFYVISAFTLFLSLSVRQETNSTLNFFIRRFFRIAPMFYLTVLFGCLLYGWEPRHVHMPPVTPLSLLATLTFTNGWNPYWMNNAVEGGWSVATEMMFYLMVPFAWKKIRSLDSAAGFTFGFLLFGIAANRVAITHVPIANGALWRQFHSMWLPVQLPVFGLGFVLFFLHQSLLPRLPEVKNQKGKAALLLGICVYAWLALAFGNFEFIPTQFLYAASFVVLTVALMLHPCKILVNSATRYLGKVSYSIYLTHFFCIAPVQAVLAWSMAATHRPVGPRLTYLLTLALTLAASTIISTITYRLVEIPGQNLGRRLIAHLQARKARTLPAPLDAAL